MELQALGFLTPSQTSFRHLWLSVFLHVLRHRLIAISLTGISKQRFCGQVSLGNAGLIKVKQASLLQDCLDPFIGGCAGVYRLLLVSLYGYNYWLWLYSRFFNCQMRGPHLSEAQKHKSIQTKALWVTLWRRLTCLAPLWVLCAHDHDEPGKVNSVLEGFWLCSLVYFHCLRQWQFMVSAQQMLVKWLQIITIISWVPGFVFNFFQVLHLTLKTTQRTSSHCFSIL